MKKASNYALYLSGIITEAQYDLAEGDNAVAGMTGPSGMGNKMPQTPPSDSHVDDVHMKKFLNKLESMAGVDVDKKNKFINLFNKIRPVLHQEKDGEELMNTFFELLDLLGSLQPMRAKGQEKIAGLGSM